MLAIQADNNYLNQQDTTAMQLTHREKQCIKYLLKGFTMKEVGRMMNISHRTVESHIANMKNKLGFSNTKKMVFYLFNTMNHKV
ncbi:MAG: helix-turn-helix transcriptional regulator [Gammaproteobacteria bacterium]|nr:helix-turn-helix transcriptional regulator [Gammaproteobacteria bacterium]MCH9743523.1 helix-turn-helix transcriptional regulator [Gammaproteobacteria bacterium]